MDRTETSPGRELKVLYIAGWGRSGTTLLGNILGEADGFFSVGELTYLWSRGLQGGFRCGCGRRLRDCDVWSQVLEAPFGDGRIGDIDPVRVSQLQSSALRIRHTWRLLRGSDRERLSPAVRLYRDLLAAVYAAVADVTGAKVIVDSSKRPSDAALLLRMSDIQPYLVHMVRDPRAVAYSWKRKKWQSGFGDARTMLTRSAWSSTGYWMVSNAATSAVRRRILTSTRLNYEGLVGSPKEEVRSLLELIGEKPSALPFMDDHTVVLGDNHTVSGNPSRFERGRIPIRADDEWVVDQSRSDRWLTSIMALPLLGRYGYRLRTAPSTGGDET